MKLSTTRALVVNLVCSANLFRVASICAAVPEDENWDAGFPLPPGLNGPVSVVAAAGNHLYAAGDFSRAGDVTAGNIARWDGVRWSALGDGVRGSVYAVIEQGGDVYIGGNFTIGAPIMATNVAKWDGRNWSALGGGVGENYEFVYALAMHRGDLVAGGSFSVASGEKAANVARWDGQHWHSVGGGIGGDAASVPGEQRFTPVFALAAHGSSLYVGGHFQSAGGVLVSNIACWDGKTWSSLGPGLSGGGNYITIGQFGEYSGEVRALLVEKGELIVGGSFLQAGTARISNLATWDGRAWSQLGAGVHGVVGALISLGRDVYLSGYFEQAGETSARNIARWDGNRFYALGPGVRGTVPTLCAWRGGVYAGGGFGLAGDAQAAFIARWDGTSWSALGARGVKGNTLFGDINDIAVDGASAYVVGRLTAAGDLALNNIVRLDGTQWSDVGGGIPGGILWRAAVSGGRVYVGGVFTLSAAGATNIACWTGAHWESLGSGLRNQAGGPGLISEMHAVGTKIYVAGQFTMAGERAATNLAVWDGASWSDVGEGVRFAVPEGGNDLPGWVTAMADDGFNLYVGGQFERAGSLSATNLAQWNGSGWSAVAAGPFSVWNSSILQLAVRGTRLYVAGTAPPPNAAGYVDPLLVEWTGAVWSEPLATNFFSALTSSDAGVYLGTGPELGGLAVNGLARWDGSRWQAVGSGLHLSDYPAGTAFVLRAGGGKLYVGGRFDEAGGKPAHNFAVWHEP